MNKKDIVLEEGISIDNINILSVDEMIKLRKRYKRELYNYTSGSKEYNIVYCKIDLLTDMIYKKIGLSNKKQLDENMNILNEIREDNKKGSTKENLKEFKEEFKSKTKEEINKQFEDFKESTIPDLKTDDGKIRDIIRNATLSSTIERQEKHLNVDKIVSLEDVKRVLKFLKIKAIDDGVIQTSGFEEVRDLFE